MTDEMKACPFCGSEMDLAHVSQSAVLCSNKNCYFYSIYIPINTFQSRPLEDALHKQLASRDADLARAWRYITGLEKSVPENNLAVARLSLALVDAKTLIERLIEVGCRLAGSKMVSGRWDSLLVEYHATVSKTESVGKESVE